MFQREMTHVLRRVPVSRKRSRGTCQTETQCLARNRGKRKTGRQAEGQEACLQCLKGQRIQDWQGVLNYRLALVMGACHPTSTRIKPCAAALQHRLKGVQGGEQKRGPLCWTGRGGTGRTGLQILRYYQELIL